MKKEVAKKILRETGIIYIPWYKKIKISISDFERYPEMAAEGVQRALSYLAILMLVFSLIFGAGIIINLKEIVTNSTTLSENMYPKIDEDMKKLIIESREELIQTLNNPEENIGDYITIIIVTFLNVFLAYFIFTLMNILFLSVFGTLTSLIAGMKIRYRAIFNMTVYAITLSTILQLVYLVMNLFVNFEVKYFDLMYTAIAYVCLVAAIFMIKSDVIKEQIELIKIAKQRKEEEADEQEEKKEDKEEQDETSEENQEENGTSEDKDKNDLEGQGQGSNA